MVKVETIDVRASGEGEQAEQTKKRVVAFYAAAIGVMDWVLFQYAGPARGWGRKNEPLARFDIVFGLFLPFILVNYLVIAVFAGTLHKLGLHPEVSLGTKSPRSIAPQSTPTNTRHIAKLTSMTPMLIFMKFSPNLMPRFPRP